MERAGASALDRLIFLSDGVFAIAMTLLVVQLTGPELATADPAEIPQRLLSLGPKYLSYVVSFLTIASYWAAHQRIFRYVVRADNVLVWLNIVLLLCIAFQPFPTDVLGTYGDQPSAVAFYAGTLTVTGLVLLALWLYAAVGHRLIAPEVSPRLVEHQIWRAVIVPVVFVISIGIAQVNPTLAKYSWLAIAVLVAALRWIYGHV